MRTKLTSLREVKNNPNNPRTIRDEKFVKLVKSLKEFPEMINARPLVVNKTQEVLGGNMRLKAMIEAGWTEAPVIQVDWSEAKQKEFIVKDNLGYGDWDWDALANEWDPSELNAWGLDVWNPDDIDMDSFFEEDESIEKNSTKIVLEYSEDDYALVLQAFEERDGSKEDIVFKLLGL
tara:strand:+ start:1402 stop:1932 length:531 start_codon:yes stop_codon:yes gene_type:complete